MQSKTAVQQTASATNLRTYKSIRFITATSLFDGHDASINVVRRLLQAAGVEVIHLGHNRSAKEIVDAAIEEDAIGIAISSYQGGHIEFFKFVVDMLRERRRQDICVFGGGGGVIVRAEIEKLEAYGVTRIYSPDDGQVMGLQGMINDMLVRVKDRPLPNILPDLDNLNQYDHGAISQLISVIENRTLGSRFSEEIKTKLESTRRQLAPVIGITGTGGSGKSSLSDELILRWRLDQGDMFRIAILAIDPYRKKTGGALLGDRIRMNSIDSDAIFMRSLVSSTPELTMPASLVDSIQVLQLAEFDLVLIETPGIGQGNSEITSVTDLSIYVMTPEFGSPSQLEKIEMLDYADLVAINKSDRIGGKDAIRDVGKQLQRNRQEFERNISEMPVFGTVASRFNDEGVSNLFLSINEHLAKLGFTSQNTNNANSFRGNSSSCDIIVPAGRRNYLGEIAATIDDYLSNVDSIVGIARQRQQLYEVIRLFEDDGQSSDELHELAKKRDSELDNNAKELLVEHAEARKHYQSEANSNQDSSNFFVSLSGTRLPKINFPQYSDDGDTLRWLMLENFPGHFPFTAGAFRKRRDNEEPTRMFAGEGDACRTNARFRLLSKDSSAKRLSTAFDSVTLYGANPDRRPDIYGKVGTSGVSISTLDDMKELYSGFDLCDSGTSVSMTINGPAPIILAFYFNAAIDQQLLLYREEHGKDATTLTAARIRASTLQNVRGTVQADILKEDQGQNTCLFSIDFGLRMMGDIQEYFVDNNIRNFYSVSISGYHIAEAGANPITQLAFTLANGFTYVEAHLARGMKIDDFAHNLSFFFSNGMDPEYGVMGRVARRIWAIVMRDRYGANERSQKLKYHIQTSGRSLHAQEMSFNDIRTTLQALIAINDNCNSLHTNANDEAITTPSEDSVRRALAIQKIISEEWGLSQYENLNQGSFAIEDLTNLVEHAVIEEFRRIDQRGGVLGAMETGYQRGKIQEESLYYEEKKHDGSYPIIGVNTFVGSSQQEELDIQLSRGTEAERMEQLNRLETFHKKNRDRSEIEIEKLKQVALERGNIFEQLMSTVRYCSLGQITSALFDVGGKYRRNM